MNTAQVQVNGSTLALFCLDGDSAAPVELVWAHGWGHNHANLLPLAEAMRPRGRSILLDLPGFGASPMPPEAWSTADYADMAAAWLTGRKPAQRIWIAHSFGARIGLQLAARHPELVQGLFLIAAAGLPPKRSLAARAKLAGRRWAYWVARQFAPQGTARERLRKRFGSADYRAAGALRPILVKAVREDLSEVARTLRCRTMLVYGDQDRETPPEIGERLNRLIPGSRLVILRGFDHWTVLTEGRHQIVHRLGEFLEQLR